MFCMKCGSQLPDDSTFCTACGAAIPNAGTPARSGDSFFGKVMQYISGIFKSPSKNAQDLSSEKRLVFLVYEIAKLLFALGATMMVCLAISLDMGGAEPLRTAVNSSLLGGSVGFQILFAILSYGAGFGLLYLMTWVCSTKITKLKVPAIVILNICSVSTLPVLGVLVAFLFVGFIWLPLVIILLLTAALLNAILYTENIRASGIFGSETMWKNALALCTAFMGSALFLILPLAIAY